MKCPECGKFMADNGLTPDPENLEDEVSLFWSCRCGYEYYQHIYFKSEFKEKDDMEVNV